jgi:uncharacterized protein YceH (UPF0502 family)
MHLFSGEAPQQVHVSVERTPPSATAGSESNVDRISALEAEVANLRTELTEVQQQLAAFRKQFE